MELRGAFQPREESESEERLQATYRLCGSLTAVVQNYCEKRDFVFPRYPKRTRGCRTHQTPITHNLTHEIWVELAPFLHFHKRHFHAQRRAVAPSYARPSAIDPTTGPARLYLIVEHLRSSHSLDDKICF